MARSAGQFTQPPHPLVSSNQLFIVDPPAEATWDQLAVLFQRCGKARPGEWSVLPSGRRKWVVIMQDVFHAEMALATLQGEYVPDLVPSWKLSLSPSPTLEYPIPLSSGRDRPFYVQSITNPQSPHELAQRSPQEVFKLFRSAGPLLSARSGSVPGFLNPICVLDYWSKDHAKYARDNCQTLHFALAALMPFTLVSYTPVVINILAVGVFLAKSGLKDMLDKFGAVHKFTCAQSTVNEATYDASVLFGNREAACAAVQDMDRTALGGSEARVLFDCPANSAPTEDTRGKSRTEAPNGARPTPSTQNGFSENETLARTRARHRIRHEVAKRKRELAQQKEDAARFEWQKVLFEKRDLERRVTSSHHAHMEAQMLWEEADAAVQEAELVLEQRKAERGYAAQQKIDTHNVVNEVAKERTRVLQRVNTAEQEEEKARIARMKAEEEENDIVRQIRELEETIRAEEIEKMRKSLEEMARLEKLERLRKEAEEMQEKARCESDSSPPADAAEEAPSTPIEASTDLETPSTPSTQEDDSALRLREYHTAVEREQARCRRRDCVYWAPSYNTAQVSIDRFTAVSAEFDDTHFSAAQPLTFESVPWPLARLPLTMSLDDIEWGAVEQFFGEVRRRVGEAEYRSVVERAHRRFHPDKWRARGLLKTVLDEELRGKLENAGNVVAQAITPLWLASRVS